MATRLRETRGSATIEQTGLMLLVAAAFVALVSFQLLLRDPPGHELGERVANRIACGPRAGEVCRRHPAVNAYGWPLARLVRYLAPLPMARPGPDGAALVPVDFRYCQRPSCAMPRGGERGERLTTANRRTTVFTEVIDRRGRAGSGAGGGEASGRGDGQILGTGTGESVGAGLGSGTGERRVEITYWLYRPSLGWEALRKSATSADIEAASGTRVLLGDSPNLVPLEILPGRNHYDLPPGDEPPWRWKVPPIHNGHSA